MPYIEVCGSSVHLLKENNLKVLQHKLFMSSYIVCMRLAGRRLFALLHWDTPSLYEVGRAKVISPAQLRHSIEKNG